MYYLDLLGVFAFAYYGAYHGAKAKFGLIGIVFCGALTALGGGTIRELLLQRQPIYFAHKEYLVAVLLGVAISLLMHARFARLDRYAILLDAIGLVAFAFIGAEAGYRAGVGIAGMAFFAALTAAGGGIMTDVITGRKPTALRNNYYILPTVLVAILVYVAGGRVHVLHITAGILLAGYSLRLGFIIHERHWHRKAKTLLRPKRQHLGPISTPDQA